MPIGSDEPVSLRSFFMLTLSWWVRAAFGGIIGTPHAVLDAGRKWLLRNDLQSYPAY